MKRWKQTVKELYGYVLSVVVFVCVLALFVTGILFFSKKADARGADTLRDAIRRASVQCYAITVDLHPILCRILRSIFTNNSWEVRGWAAEMIIRDSW